MEGDFRRWSREMKEGRAILMLGIEEDKLEKWI